MPFPRIRVHILLVRVSGNPRPRSVPPPHLRVSSCSPSLLPLPFPALLSSTSVNIAFHAGFGMNSVAASMTTSACRAASRRASQCSNATPHWLTPFQPPCLGAFSLCKAPVIPLCLCSRSALLIHSCVSPPRLLSLGLSSSLSLASPSTPTRSLPHILLWLP